MFSGETYEPCRDKERLASQLNGVRWLMSDGKWRTLDAIGAYVKGSSASPSARLRDLRKERFGGHDVQRRYLNRGVWEYRVQFNHGDGGER